MELADLNSRGQRSAERYEQAKARLERPMTVLAVVLGVLLVIPLAADVSVATETNLDIAGWIVWVAFVAEYLWLLWLAPIRSRMIREHPLELLLIALPMFRPFRALRVVGILAGSGVSYRTLSKIANRKGLQWFLVVAVCVVGAGALGVLSVERKAAGTQIVDIGDALWWAIVTCTTVGYGDLAPVTPAGQVIAVVLMVLGISIVSVVTAHVASVLIEEDTESDMERLELKIEALTNKLDQLVGQRENLN